MHALSQGQPASEGPGPEAGQAPGNATHRDLGLLAFDHTHLPLVLRFARHRSQFLLVVGKRQLRALAIQLPVMQLVHVVLGERQLPPLPRLEIMRRRPWHQSALNRDARLLRPAATRRRRRRRRGGWLTCNPCGRHQRQWEPRQPQPRPIRSALTALDVTGGRPPLRLCCPQPVRPDARQPGHRGAACRRWRCRHRVQPVEARQHQGEHKAQSPPLGCHGPYKFHKTQKRSSRGPPTRTTISCPAIMHVRARWRVRVPRVRTGVRGVCAAGWRRLRLPLGAACCGDDVLRVWI